MEPALGDSFRAYYQEKVRLLGPKIDALLTSSCSERHGRDSILSKMLVFHLGTGGKRLRAMLPIMVTESLDSEIAPPLPFAAACEMFHNATLVHDDLQDGDDVRRGQPTVWSKWGGAQAINLGDVMFFHALLLLDQQKASAAVRDQLRHRFLVAAATVVEGQALEFSLKDGLRPDLTDYLGIARRKTASLIALAVTGGGLIAGANEALDRAVENVGYFLGEAFQIQDDLLDLYGDKGREKRGADIAEGKPSALVAAVGPNCDVEDRRRLVEILHRPREDTCEPDIQWAADFFERSGARRRCVCELRSRLASARGIADHDLPEKTRELVHGLCDLIVVPIQGLLVAGC